MLRQLILTALVFPALLAPQLILAEETRPNVLWFVIDDMSHHLSCYGETAIQTPHCDQLASSGTLFTRAYVTAPVCSTSRSAMITGMYQTTIGAHHHRSGRGELKIYLPKDVDPTPVLFQRAGYYTCIGSGLPGKDHRGMDIDQKTQRSIDRTSTENPLRRLGKTDYNFEWDPAIYDSNDWSERAAGQPFFMQVQLHGGKLREGSVAARASFRQRVIEELGSATDPATVTLPPYYPDHPVLREDWALYLDAVRITDKHVGEVIARLESEGELANTLIIFMADHGISHARGKQFLTDEGTQIPFIVRGAGVPAGATRDDLVEHIDMAAVSLAAAGIEIPASMQGKNFLASDYQPRDAIYAARDRCDETVERIRSVRTDRLLYLRNFYPQRPHLQPNAYKDGKAIVQTIRQLHANCTLPTLPKNLLLSPTRPQEELYDYHRDPAQIKNLASDLAYAEQLLAHREMMDQWMERTRDPGAEPEAMYDSDMAVYLKKKNPQVEKNIALMKRWAKEGK